LHVIHSLNNKRVDEHTPRDVAFLLTNKKGNFLSLGNGNFSHTQGLFFFDKEKWSPYKTIEDIRLNAEMTAIKNNFYDAERHYRGGAEESFALFNNSMMYDLRNYTGELTLELDFRHMFDFDDKGRIYTITKEEDLIIIKYEKFNDHSLGELESTHFIAIRGAEASGFNVLNQWVKRNYQYDDSRHSHSEFYIIKALSIKVNNHLHLAFSFSKDKAEAKAHANQVFENREYVSGSMKKYAMHTFTSPDMALSAAMKALDDLVMSVDSNGRTVGIFAGLPWFCQFWARDELISLKALMIQEKYPLVKSILFKYLQSIGEDGLVPNRLPESEVKSIDAVGWLFLRLREFLEMLVANNMVDDYLSLTELVTIKRELENAINGLIHNHTHNGLIISGLQESWMDTKKASRSGACIEVQALFLSMLKMHNAIAKVTRSKQLFKTVEKEFREKIKQTFYIDGMLLDCVEGTLSESTARPNIFLAYYAYPELLSKNEWKQAFDNALKALWLDWGGLSSINHISPLFRPEYTGEDDDSYHNGDSWYYVNNYAALAMQRLDREYYAKYIDRIVSANKEEILFSGFIGCASEISSAKEMRSEGCLSQAWSAASFIELMHEIGRK
jgi:glycogen debranching enzyme